MIAEAAMKRAEEGPAMPARLKEWLPTVADGDQFAGKVTRVCGYGAFVELYIGGDPYDPEAFISASYDRPWRPVGLIHISSIADNRVDDVEAYTEATVGPVGSRVVVAIRSTTYNDRKRVSLDLVEVLHRGDFSGEALARQGGGSERVGWVTTARERGVQARIGKNSAERSVVWPLVATGAAATQAASAADKSEDRRGDDRLDRSKAVVYRNY